MANSKYWNEKIETMPRAELEKLQLRKLKEQLKHCYEDSAFYRKKFQDAGLKPDDIKTLEDIINFIKGLILARIIIYIH